MHCALALLPQASDPRQRFRRATRQIRLAVFQVHSSTAWRCCDSMHSSTARRCCDSPSAMLRCPPLHGDVAMVRCHAVLPVPITIPPCRGDDEVVIKSTSHLRCDPVRPTSPLTLRSKDLSRSIERILPHMYCRRDPVRPTSPLTLRSKDLNRSIERVLPHHYCRRDRHRPPRSYRRRARATSMDNGAGSGTVGTRLVQLEKTSFPHL